MLFDGVEIARIVIDGDAGIVDEDVERADLFDRLLDLCGVSHVQRQRRHAFVGNLQCRAARSGIYALCSAADRFVDECAADAAIGPGDQNGLVRDGHVGLLLVQNCSGSSFRRPHW
jgi:hypothetical protein